MPCKTLCMSMVVIVELEAGFPLQLQLQLQLNLGLKDLTRVSRRPFEPELNWLPIIVNWITDKA
jgi:hypothetical protein